MLILGIDTGGTYTDGVVVDRDTRKVLCKAKAFTTHNDLTAGMENCMRAMKIDRWERIEQVSLSTTLATNAIVEGKGGRVGLLLLGGKPEGRLPAEVCVQLGARVNIRGGVCERLDEAELEDALLRFQDQCDAVAISGYASVRNPVHEVQAARKVNETIGLPVVCGHELTSTLGFYERTVTAVLNARLIPLVRNLITAVCWVMSRFGVQAPIMIVRGDGSLMRADYSMERPVETVLSGPAASVIGARFLSRQDNCIVVDMGGTTTDIACLQKGKCTVSTEGARLAGWRTRVKALEICTFGLGGDSEIRPDQDGSVRIGPRRVTPLCRPHMDKELCGLTPTDVLHLTGEYTCWDAEKSRGGAQTMARQCGRETAPFVQALREQIVERLTDCCRAGIEAFDVKESLPLVGVGAPSRIWLADAAAVLKLCSEVPPNAEVANAVGAAVAQVRETSQALIRPNKRNNTYYIFCEGQRLCAADLVQAEQIASHTVRETVSCKARRAGAQDFEVREEKQQIMDQTGTFIELRVRAVACGKPR